MDEQFPPPVVPSELPGPDYPELTKFLRRQVDMQFADLRLLFRLPVPELDPHVGCNLTAASMMLNVISGFSRWFYRTERAAKILEKETKKGHALSAERFKGFVESTGRSKRPGRRPPKSPSGCTRCGTRSPTISAHATTRGQARPSTSRSARALCRWKTW